MHPIEGTHLGQFMKNCSPWEGPMLEQLMEDCLPWEGPHAGAGTEGEESFPQGGRSGRDNADGLTTAPIPCPPALLGGRRWRNGSEVEPRKKREGGRCFFKIWVYFSLSYSNLIGDKLISLSRACFACDSNW